MAAIEKGIPRYTVAMDLGPQEEKMVTEIMKQEFKNQCNVLPINILEQRSVLKKAGQPMLLFVSFSNRAANFLQLLRELASENKELLICVCASMHSYELVSELAACGMTAYLTIPLRKVQTQQVIGRMFEKADKLFEKMQEERRLREHISRNVHMLEVGFLHTILEESGQEKNLEEYCKELKLTPQGYMLSILYKNNVDQCELVKFEQEMLKNIKTALMGVGNVAGMRACNHFVVYVEEPDRKSKGDKENYYIECIQKQFATSKYSEIDVQIGNLYSINEIYKSYQQALQNRCMKENSNTVHLDKYTFYREYTNLVKRLMDAVRFIREDAGEIFMKILLLTDAYEREEKINRIVQILIMCAHVAYVDNGSELQLLDIHQVMKEVDSQEDLNAWGYQKFDHIFNALQKHQGRTTSDTIKMAIEYIEKNFSNEISLEDVSKYVGISPQHFSKIFKEETGANYVDWLTQLRIEQAKNYLTSGKNTIKEVCYLVGYKDPNYFSRIFRKVVGIPPSEYVRTQR